MSAFHKRSGGLGRGPSLLKFHYFKRAPCFDRFPPFHHDLWIYFKELRAPQCIGCSSPYSPLQQTLTCFNLPSCVSLLAFKNFLLPSPTLSFFLSLLMLGRLWNAFASPFFVLLLSVVNERFVLSRNSAAFPLPPFPRPCGDLYARP